MDKHLRKAEGDGTCGLALVPTRERSMRGFWVQIEPFQYHLASPKWQGLEAKVFIFRSYKNVTHNYKGLEPASQSITHTHLLL